jgi:hypothetical protein
MDSRARVVVISQLSNPEEAAFVFPSKISLITHDSALCDV